MQKTLYFLKKNEMNNEGLLIYNEKILTIYLPICGLTVEKSEDAFLYIKTSEKSNN